MMNMLPANNRTVNGTRVRPVNGQAGSALTETIVLSAVMVPLAFTIPMIGKLADLRQTAVQSSRFMAWQESHDPAGQMSQNLLHERFYNNPDSSTDCGAAVQISH